MKLQRFPIGSLAMGAVILSGCGGQESKDSTDAGIISAGKETYVHIADAEEFLPTWSKENTVVYHMIGDPDDMHPANGNSATRSMIHMYTQNYIIGSDVVELKGGRPDVVKAMPEVSANELEFTYELRDEPTWDNGEQLTVDDIIFTFKAIKCPLTNNPHAKPYVENLKDIVQDPSNPRKFTMTMKRKYIQNIVFLTDYPLLQESYWDKAKVLRNYTFAQMDDPTFNAASKKDLNAWATEFNSPKYSRNPEFLVGLGPYRFADWKPGQSYTLVKKENHWTSKVTEPNSFQTAYPDKIIFKNNSDNNSQMLEFKAQAMDGSTWLDTKMLIELQNDPNFNQNYHSRSTNTYNYSYMSFNCRPDGVEHKKIFDDKRVRKAVAMLVPLDEINMVLNNGLNTRMVGPVSPLKEEYNTDLALIDYDLEGARKLLADAGWTDTDGDNILDKVVDGQKTKFEFNLHYMTATVSWKDMAQMISEALYEAGIKCNIIPLDFAIHYDRARNHKFDAMLASWAGSSVPEDFTQIWHSSSWASKGSNFSGFGNAKSDALIDSIKYTLDPALRHPMVKELQSMIYDEQPYVFMYAANRRNVIHKRFGNAHMYFERPGILINNWKLLAGAASTASPSL
jgi:peptide/nickel transport system substrate-binding protein